MRRQQKINSIARVVLGVPAFLLLFTAIGATGEHSQDVNFRLLTIERRVDQLQQRMDYIERTIQNQTLNRTNESGASTALVLELQRQQLSLAEQVVQIQRRMLDFQKRIDQMREENEGKKEKPGEETKKKPAQGKP
ncbi:MAG: hypothetical protein L0226_07430 [Acidobacteria bacterium]|nr:hypothetical protein [Acidobacteriota bacterium]